MRASSIASLVLLALASACSPEEPPVVVAPEPPTPADLPGPSQATADELLREVEPVRSGGPSQSTINSIRERTQAGGPSQAAAPLSARDLSRTLDRLTFQCAEEKTFAIRIRGNRLEVFPPGITMSYLVLIEVPTDSGVRYTAADADFRMANDLATLQFGRERYTDCVSSPAAAVWQEPPRRDLLPRRGAGP